MPEHNILSGAETLRNLQINDSFKYFLVMKKGLDNSENTMKISETAERCKRLKLKPLQKLDLLCKYILPAMYHLLFTDLTSNNTLNQLDQIIKRTAKDFFHLPTSTSDRLVHSRVKDGGLGVPRLLDVVRAAHMYET